MRLAIATKSCFWCSLVALAHALPHSSALACVGPPIVFFESGKAELSVTSKKVLDWAAESLEGGQHRVTIKGHADRSGAPEQNLELSQRRAKAVQRYLVSKGILAERMDVESQGESRPLVETDDEVPEYQNRRVEVEPEGWCGPPPRPPSQPR